MRQGLDFIFTDWALVNGTDIFNLGGIDAIIRFYERRDQEYGFKRRDVSEIAVQSVARQLLEVGRLDELTGLLKQFRGSFQPPPRVYVQIAEAYRDRGENGAAMALYRQALEADPNLAAAQTALAELGGN